MLRRGLGLGLGLRFGRGSTCKSADGSLADDTVWRSRLWTRAAPVLASLLFAALPGAGANFGMLRVCRCDVSRLVPPSWDVPAQLETVAIRIKV